MFPVGYEVKELDMGKRGIVVGYSGNDVKVDFAGNIMYKKANEILLWSNGKSLINVRATLEVESKIVKKEDGYYVVSEKGKNLGGPYPSRSQAEKRLKQVEFFKHKKSELELELIRRGFVRSLANFISNDIFAEIYDKSIKKLFANELPLDDETIREISEYQIMYDDKDMNEIIDRVSALYEIEDMKKEIVSCFNSIYRNEGL